MGARTAVLRVALTAQGSPHPGGGLQDRQGGGTQGVRHRLRGDPG